jgi:hypothetical protein
MDEGQLNGRRAARYGTAASQESVMTEERPDVSSGHENGHESGHDGSPDNGPAPAFGGPSAGPSGGPTAGPPAESSAAMDRHTRRRLAAEAAADAAEAAASEAASRAAAAIKAAARAAEEAEAAADAAARAADEALAAAEAETRAQAVQRSVPAVPPAPPAPRSANGHAPNGHPVAGAPSRPGRSIEHDETTEIAAVRAGGRRHRHSVDEADGAAAPIEPEVPAEVTAVVPAARDRVEPRGADSRAARRRAQEAAAAVAREASRDPVTDAIDITELRAAGLQPGGPRVEDGMTQVVQGRLRADYDEYDEYGREEFDDFDPEHSGEFDAAGQRRSSLVTQDDDGEGETSWFGRPVVYAVGGVLVIIGLIVALVMVLGGGGSAPAPAAAGPAGQPPAPAADAGAAAAGAVDPTSPKAVAFLDSLRDQGITTSKSGVSETQAANGICNQISQGVDETSLAKSLPTQLPTVAKKQASLFVELAQKKYC